jgi:flagellar protein FlgJ
MAINAIGSFYLDQARLAPVASPVVSDTASGAGATSGANFAALLEKSVDATKAAAAAGAEAATTAGAEPQKPAGKPVIDKTDKLYEQCEALEGFLIKNLLTGMRATVQKSGFIDEGFAGKMYEDMLYDEYTKDFTKNAGLGLAELAYLELSGQRGKIPPNSYM